MKKKKILAWILSISMIVCVIPTFSLSAFADDGYSVIVGGTTLTSEKQADNTWSVIYASVEDGNVTITTTPPSDSYIKLEVETATVNNDDEPTTINKATVTVKGAQISTNGNGIYTDEGYLTVIGEYGEDGTTKSSIICNATDPETNTTAIRCNTQLTIKGVWGEISADTGLTARGSVIIDKNADMGAVSGTNYGIYSGTGGQIEIAGNVNSITGTNNRGIMGNDVKISGAVKTITGAICGIDSTMSVSISKADCSITATGEAIDGILGSGFGIHTKTLSVSDNAIVDTNGILAKNTKYNCCIVYDGNNGEVYGLVELDYAEYTPPAGKTLTNNGIIHFPNTRLWNDLLGNRLPDYLMIFENGIKTKINGVVLFTQPGTTFQMRIKKYEFDPNTGRFSYNCGPDNYTIPGLDVNTMKVYDPDDETSEYYLGMGKARLTKTTDENGTINAVLTLDNASVYASDSYSAVPVCGIKADGMNLTIQGSGNSQITTNAGDNEAYAVYVKNGSLTIGNGLNVTSPSGYKIETKTTGEDSFTTILDKGNNVVKSVTLGTTIDINSVDVKIEPSAFTYNGQEQTPNISVMHDDTVLTENTDYTAEGNFSATDVGDYTITLTGKGNYTGTIEKTWSITKYTPSKNDFTFVPPANLIYDGTEKSAAITSALPNLGAINCRYCDDAGNVINAPKESGTYHVQVSVEENEYYNAVSWLEVGSFTISVKESAPSSGGGGGGYSSTTTVINKSEDNTSTTTVTNKRTGVVTQTTKTENDITATTTTDKNGEITNICVDIPSSVAGNNDTIKLPIDVAPDTNVQINTPSGGATVEIPVSGITPAHVAVIVDKNGKENVVITSVNTNNGVILTLKSDATVKIVDNGKTFSDVAKDAWYADATAFVSARNIMNGTEQDMFSPEDFTTRAMIVTTIWRIAGSPKAISDLTFSDVADDTWYTEAVRWAMENGIVTGYTTDTFAPDDLITREQLTAIIHRYANSPASNKNLDAFADTDQISDYSKQAMAWAHENGIINGYDGRIYPDDTATRAQVAQILMNFLNRI